MLISMSGFVCAKLFFLTAGLSDWAWYLKKIYFPLLKIKHIFSSSGIRTPLPESPLIGLIHLSEGLINVVVM